MNWKQAIRNALRFKKHRDESDYRRAVETAAKLGASIQWEDHEKLGTWHDEVVLQDSFHRTCFQWDTFNFRVNPAQSPIGESKC